jgi:hypothetical protein
VDNHLIYIASNLTNEELRNRVDNSHSYLPESVEAAIAELKNRGVEISDEKAEAIKRSIETEQDFIELPKNNSNLFTGFFSINNIVEDPSAPLFYSRTTIFMFTVFVGGLTVFAGAIFGSVLLAINLNRNNNKSAAFWAVLFGFIFTILQIKLISHLYIGMGGCFPFSLIAAGCLDYFFWNRFIGATTVYRKRPIWGALFVAILVISSLLFLGAIFGSIGFVF